MKKLLAVLLTATMVLSVMLSGCGTQNTPATGNTPEPEKKITIGLALATQKEERWSKEAKHFQEAAEKLGATVVIQDANNDEKTQNDQIENLINQKVDAIVLVPANSKTAGTSVKKIKDAGIPVMAYSRLIKDVQYDCFIGFDVVDIGRSIAKAAVIKVPKGNYMIMNGGQTDINSKLYWDGYQEVLKPYIDKGDIKIVSDQWADDWSNEKALSLAENALTQNNNACDAYICSNDGMAGAVIQALKAQGLDGKTLVAGSDGETAALQRIVEGTQTTTLLFPSKSMAEKAAEAAIEMAKTKKSPASASASSEAGSVKIPTIFVSTIPVDKDNINEVIIKAGIAKVEDVYKNVDKALWPK